MHPFPSAATTMMGVGGIGVAVGGMGVGGAAGATHPTNSSVIKTAHITCRECLFRLICPYPLIAANKPPIRLITCSILSQIAMECNRMWA